METTKIDCIYLKRFQPEAKRRDVDYLIEKSEDC